MNTPTPETDALAVKAGITITNTLIWEHARNLECERDEYKKLLSETLKSDMSVLERLLLECDEARSLVKAVEQGYGKLSKELIAERDQLRKVCDELAYILARMPDPFFTSTKQVFADYNSLPHVIAAKKCNE